MVLIMRSLTRFATSFTTVFFTSNLLTAKKVRLVSSRVILSLFLLSGFTSVAMAQSLTEQLEQGLQLSPKPEASKPDAGNANIQSNNQVSAPANASSQNLSEQIETLKQAMINLNRDLFILEEDLLFPSSTQVAVYLSMDVGEYFGLDAVEIRINGEVKTYYLYTSRQVNALYRGGVQRLYVGNVSQGDHELTAYFVGIGPENREYKRAVSIEFDKDEDPVAIELSVVDSTAKQQPIFNATKL